MKGMFAAMVKATVEIAEADPQGLTTNQVAWASSHDWYVSICHLGNLDGVKVFDSTSNELVEFYSFRALREWAGY